MFYIDILAEGADGGTPVPMKGLNQGVGLRVIPRSVDSMPERHADKTK